MDSRDRDPAPLPPSDSPSNELHDAHSLPGLLLARAAAQPEQPWLFVQRGLDWRWRSFGAIAARVERLRAALVAGAARLPPAAVPRAGGAGTRVDVMRIGLEDDGGPDVIALDLAIQAAGACAAPLPPGLTAEAREAALAECGCTAHAALGGFTEDPRPSADLAQPPRAAAADLVESRTATASADPRVPVPGRLAVLYLPRDAPSESTAPTAPSWSGGPVLVGGEGRWRELPQARLIAEVNALGARLAPPDPPRRPHGFAAARRPARRRREILVLPRPLADPAGRRLAAWSLAAGAALVLEPDRPRLAVTAAWVRPTVFAGDPAEIAALRAEAESRRSRRRRLPFGRLHTVAVIGGEPLPAADRAFWTGRGTAVTVV